MQKENLDLTKEKYANQSRNETMLKGMHILNGVLVIAYLIEVIKGARTPFSYLIVACMCLIPNIVARLIYFKKKILLSYDISWDMVFYCFMHMLCLRPLQN